ncbi:MAG: Coenzyme F420 hydrogenase/dehydrogenase, beta subunit C-terminal domain [Clostridiales bacterium]|nr:Coenzyme F420 hydrogenase/dehydrogenase, beta subunit C-terminal domain [Clostridiales bacterium]
MIEIKDKSQCTGCNACGDACPQNAISFVTDAEGFWYPEIDSSLCTKCGICDKTCPVINEVSQKKTNYMEPKCYAGEHKSIDVVFSSTSGGMFSALADVMYGEGGYVGGAVHNEDFSVSHFISKDRKDLARLRRSKDLQSNAEGFYAKVREILESGSKALVCGLPCQISGLLNYLGKEYTNLITVDLICAGVNSPKVWRRYLDYIEEINGSAIVYTENKSKEFGWRNLTQKFVFENGEEYFDTQKTSLFIKGYIGSHLFCRPSCYDCRFKGFPRTADITIGDFWGIEKHRKGYDSDMGTSVILINNDKGARFFETARKRIKCEENDLKCAVEGNPSLLRSMSVLSDKRKEFFGDLDRLRFDDLIAKYDTSKDHRFKNRIKRSLKFNLHIIRVTRLSPIALFQTLRYSGIRNLTKGKGIVCGTNCHINIDRSAKLEFDGIFTLGRKDKFKRSKAESNLYIGKNAALKIGGNFELDANNEIVIFEGAELIIHGAKNWYSDANSGLRIVCGQKIEIMNDVGIGRNVTIRDTNGLGHYLNTAGYRPSRPVSIGEKAWLCESSSIMPGVKIGRGAVVGAYSLVTRSIPDHAMASGSPAEVVQENVLWKW